MSQSKLVDVSRWNHPFNTAIDWHTVKNVGIGGAFVAATEGNYFTNPWLGRDVDGLHLNGMNIGYYHYLIPTIPAAEQAGYLWSRIAHLPRTIGVALDFEELHGMSFEAAGQVARAFLDGLPKEVINRSLYSNEWFLSNLPGAPWGHHLWLAQWDTMPQRAVWCWQYSNNGHVPGIDGPVDLDVLYR